MFTTLTLLLILGITVVGFWLIRSQRWRVIYLSLASLLWIWYWQIEALQAVLLLTLVTWLAGHWLQRGSQKLRAFRLGVLALVLALIGWKYLGLISSTLRIIYGGFPLLGAKLTVPLGLSYLIFKYISYLTDIHWGLIKSAKPWDLLCYGSLFTIFSAGPLERFERFEAQLDTEPQRFDFQGIEPGIIRIAEGLFLKVVLADWLAYLTGPLWDNPTDLGSVTRVLALFGYSLRIYFDFAGYSSIAIGASLLFGLRISENFNSPYLSTNITDFWRRWHISLSDWIRDYLFFPLSQGRANKLWLRWMVPLFVMLICGIWHGAAWNFALWGLWHGFGIAVYQAWQRWRRKKKLPAAKDAGWINQLPAMIFTFSFVTLGWLAFREGGGKLALGLLDLHYLVLVPLFAACIILLLRGFQLFSQSFLSPRWRAAYALVFSLMFYCGMETGFIYAKF